MANWQGLYFDNIKNEESKKIVQKVFEDFCNKDENKNFELSDDKTGIMIYASNNYEFLDDAGSKVLNDVMLGLREQDSDDKLVATYTYAHESQCDIEVDRKCAIYTAKYETVGVAIDDEIGYTENKRQELDTPELFNLHDDYSDGFEHYKGRFGEFEYYAPCTTFELDDLAVSERYHERFQGDPDEKYLEDLMDKVIEHPSKYDDLIQSWDFGKFGKQYGVPEGYINPNENKVEKNIAAQADKSDPAGIGGATLAARLEAKLNKTAEALKDDVNTEVKGPKGPGEA